MMSNFGPEHSLRQQAELLDREEAGEDTTVVMSGEELELLERQITAMDDLLREEVRAKFKLEVQFGKGRVGRGARAAQPFAGVMSAWLSGSKFHGGGDEKIFECADPECGAWILPHQITQRTVVQKINGKDVEEFMSLSYCSECGKIWRSEQTTGERLYKLTEQNWAFAILRMLRRLRLDADIYLKYHPEDIRYKAAMEMARDRGGEELAKARKNRGLHIYPLRNIIKDTKHGSDLYGRIRAFINA
jgi:ribosomal protein L32